VGDRKDCSRSALTAGDAYDAHGTRTRSDADRIATLLVNVTTTEDRLAASVRLTDAAIDAHLSQASPPPLPSPGAS